MTRSRARRLAAAMVAMLVVAGLTGCGIGRSMRSYTATMRPTVAADALAPVVAEVRAVLGARARVGEKVEFESCGGFWEDVEGDPLGVDISPYQVFRRLRLEVPDIAAAVPPMVAVRDQLVRSGWVVKSDETSPRADQPESASPLPAGSTSASPTRMTLLPQVVLWSANGDRSVVAEMADWTSSRPALEVVVRSGCYRHPDEG